MPFRSRATLELWLREFEGQGHDITGAIEVIVQNGFDEGDTGLVVVRLRYVPIDVYMAPLAPGDPRWATTFTRRDSEVSLTAVELRGLADELALAAEVCEFLEAASAEHIRTH
ncbi:hypothetical protein SCB71_09310 [Herbiconiux sp. KACC 21604]|uniref:hypothetical protein n=1 Tax=unclassified Herbiconiux TaxID=2618217 RepID=UPI0014910045|nr:hypothetical protein [Herbiconiux sp. SALV-R1]QJU53448.1 hypothetical protein HL652_07270 [Herbiconiux sp. SALV-R1]WPO88417.1 hypothetical protein SCB71_09310 [Herbiconiux sp. KACC 21604]